MWEVVLLLCDKVCGWKKLWMGRDVHVMMGRKGGEERRGVYSKIGRQRNVWGVQYVVCCLA